MADYDIVLELVHKLNESAVDLTRADVDELFLLSTAAKDSLPPLFHSVVKSFHSSFSNIYDEQVEFVERLARILEVTEQHGLVTDTDTESSEALIPTFSVDGDDKTRILLLCEQMRKIVLAADFLDDPHRRRLLNRIAAIESQVHQPKGIFDIVRGGVSDVGETLGKFGKDVKPLTERMKEVVQIARKNTVEYDQLPSPEEVKQLPSPDDDDH